MVLLTFCFKNKCIYESAYPSLPASNLDEALLWKENDINDYFYSILPWILIIFSSDVEHLHQKTKSRVITQGFKVNNPGLYITWIKTILPLCHIIKDK